MIRRELFACVLAVAGVLSADRAGAAVWDEKHAPVFVEEGFDAALARSKAEGRVLLVKATADWCGPCKTMDRTTWRDAKVVEWVNQRGLAIRVDIDAQPEWARRFGVSGIPVTIAFRNGEEFDRVVGSQKPEEFLRWLDGVERGEREADRLKREAGERAGPDGRVDVQARVNLARKLVSAGEMQAATEEYVWLWKNMREYEDSRSGTPFSLLSGEIGRLGKQYAPARGVFTAIRDEEQAKLQTGNVTWERLGDWITLNEIVGDEDQTLAWFDRIKQRPESKATISRESFRLARLLESRGRYRDMVFLQPNPVGEVHFAIRFSELWGTKDIPFPESMPEAERAPIRERIRESDRAGIARSYAVALLARKDSEADMALKLIRKHDPSPEMLKTIVATCIQFTAAKPEHAALLDEAEKSGADVAELRVQLKAFLDQPPP